MIGDEYLQVRTQLGNALFSLSTLAHGLEMGRDVLQTLHDIRAGLRAPFSVIVLGGAQSGKTSVINALLGEQVSPVDPREAGDKLHLFKYGAEDKSVQFSDHLVEYYRPSALLRDFNILDTPATITEGQREIIGQSLPAAELVLFVFSINDPWSPAAWELLNSFDGKWAGKAVFLLQQCDLRDDFEVNAVTIHLEQTLHEKFSPDARVFPVSSKKAYLSRTTGTDREGLMQQSGFFALESYINDTVTQSEARRQALRDVCGTVQAVVFEAAGKTNTMLDFVRKETGEMEHLNFDLEERKEQSLRHANGILWTLAECYERLQKHGEELLQRLLPVPLLPRIKDVSLHQKIQQSPDAELQDSVQRQIQSSMELLCADLQRTWRHLHESVAWRFPAEANDGTGEFFRDRRELLRGLETALTEKMSGHDLQWQMTELFTETAESLQIDRDAGPAGVITALASFVAGDFSKTLSEAAESAGSLSALIKRGRIQGRFRAEMARRREELLSAVDGQLRRAIEHFYQEASATLQPLQTFYTAQKAIYEPRTTMVRQTAEIFERTAAGLGAPP